MLSVNRNAIKLAEKILENKDALGANYYIIDGCNLIDCGVDAEGSIEAGILVSQICMGGLAELKVYRNTNYDHGMFLNVRSGKPLTATLGSQYAGWKIKIRDYFALGSGPARTLNGLENDLFNKINYHDSYDKTVIFLETRRIPSPEVIRYISRSCGIRSRDLTVIVAPTASIVGSVQISARVLETAIHRLMHLEFPLNSIIQGEGSCPIPPVAPSDIDAMGLTNDAIIMMGEVNLTVKGIADSIVEETCSKATSLNSPAYGKPFIEVLKNAAYKFYNIDPAIFSTAKINVFNKSSERKYEFGRLNWNGYLKSVSRYAGKSV